MQKLVLNRGTSSDITGYFDIDSLLLLLRANWVALEPSYHQIISRRGALKTIKSIFTGVSSSENSSIAHYYLNSDGCLVLRNAFSLKEWCRERHILKEHIGISGMGRLPCPNVTPDTVYRLANTLVVQKP